MIPWKKNKKKNIINLSSAEFAHRLVRVKGVGGGGEGGEGGGGGGGGIVCKIQHICKLQNRQKKKSWKRRIA